MNKQPRIERIDAVSERVGLPVSRIYRLMKNGQFPQSVKLSARATGFHSSEVDQWIEQLQSGAQA